MNTNTTPPEIEYIADPEVDDNLDLELRALLSTCFTGAQDEVFRHRRYFREPPAHRWMIRDEHGSLTAHLALHERTLFAGGCSFSVGGVAEVCVHPAHRGRGLLKALVAHSHRWMSQSGYAFSVLFGDPRYYASSGYVAAPNLLIDGPDASGQRAPQRASGVLVATVSEVLWPQDDEVYLPGQSF